MESLPELLLLSPIYNCVLYGHYKLFVAAHYVSSAADYYADYAVPPSALLSDLSHAPSLVRCAKLLRAMHLNYINLFLLPSDIPGNWHADG
jgi:hypothetical protein